MAAAAGPSRRFVVRCVVKRFESAMGHYLLYRLRCIATFITHTSAPNAVIKMREMEQDG